MNGESEFYAVLAKQSVAQLRLMQVEYRAYAEQFTGAAKLNCSACLQAIGDEIWNRTN